jgi:5-methylthioadenosine/S-adenosylhomocysteine deaminase
LLEDARFAILAARNRMRTKRFISAREALETATIGGANALRLGDQIGTLEPGKQADLAVVSLGNVGQQPVHDIYTALVFASSGRDVVMTMVAGEEVYRHGAPATFRRPTDKMESETIEALKAIQAKLR